MGIGFVILLWLAVGLISLLIYLGLSTLAKRSPRAALLRKVFVAFVAALVIPIGLLASINVASDFFPSHVFKSSFGFAPTPDVTELKGVRSTFGDSGSAHLCFRAEEGTIKRIINSHSFVEGSGQSKPSDKTTASGECRQPALSSDVRYYVSEHFDESFAFSHALLIYEPSSGRAYFSWEGID
jgi:hypothetical protein